MGTETWVEGHLISVEIDDGRYRVTVDRNVLADARGRERTYSSRTRAHQAGVRHLARGVMSNTDYSTPRWRSRKRRDDDAR
jgi:hypothetical protein